MTRQEVLASEKELQGITAELEAFQYEIRERIIEFTDTVLHKLATMAEQIRPPEPERPYRGFVGALEVRRGTE